MTIWAALSQATLSPPATSRWNGLRHFTRECSLDFAVILAQLRRDPGQANRLVDRLFSFAGDAQDTYPQWNCSLICAMDVYEHAYYLDFQTARAKYIDAWFQVVDWDAVNARLKAATGK